MKNSILVCLMVSALCMQISSCAKEKTDKTVSQKENINTHEDGFTPGNIYYSFVNNKYPEVLKSSLIYFAEKDIDLDGNKEALIVLDGTVLLLRNKNGNIEEIPQMANSYGFAVEDAQIITLQNTKQSYIYLTITNRASLHGFRLLELSNNKLKEICERISLTSAGEDKLIDSDNDGQYDGFVLHRFSYDVLYYDIEAYFTFENNAFRSVGMNIDMPEYPDNIQDVLLQYISLKSLYTEYLGASAQADKRLKELCTDPNSSAVKWDRGVWSQAYYETYHEFEDQIKFDIQEDAKTATATYVDEDQKQFQCQFELEKLDGKWQISKIDITKNGEK